MSKDIPGVENGQPWALGHWGRALALDPSPDPWYWWEEFTKEQRRVIIEKEIDMKIKVVQFRMDTMKLELERLQTMKSMMKGKV